MDTRFGLQAEPRPHCGEHRAESIEAAKQQGGVVQLAAASIDDLDRNIGHAGAATKH